MIDDYARILEAVAEQGTEAEAEEAFGKLVAHLKSAGRMKLLPQIARELTRLSARRRALKPKVEVAHEKEAAEALKAARAEGIDAPKAIVNPSLIRGWRARGGGKLIDRSAKRALIDIYQKITA